MNADSYAFFDVDETIIKTKSMFSFFEYWCLEHVHDAGLLLAFNAHFENARAVHATREEMNRDYYRFLNGVDPSKLASAGAIWAQRVIDSDAFHTATVSRLRELSKQGIVPVFVSGSFNEVLRPIAKNLGVHHILAAQALIGPDGALSGEIGTPQTIGMGKALSIMAFLQERGASSVNCWAFGDDISDIPMLECVGHPVAVGSNPELRAFAASHGWNILSVES